jgi:methionine aminotransferase
MRFQSKLPNQNSHIFSEMTALANQYNAINLSQGFPNFEPSKALQDLVAASLQKGTNQYAPIPGLTVLRERIAGKVALTHGITVDPDLEITVNVGATEALFNTMAAFIYPGDEVILIEPCYDCYRPAIEIMGGVPVVYKMPYPEFTVNWIHLQQLITTKTKMICISTPNNPTGTVLKHDDMLALMAIVKDTDIFILSDEVYEHMVYDDVPHISPLHYPELRERTIAAYSFGKTFHITGWRIGYCIAPPDITKELRKIHQNNTFCASHPLQAAIAKFLKDENEYLKLPNFYQKKRNLLLEVTAGSLFRPLPCPGSYFQLFDYSGISHLNDYEFCKKMAAQFGVAAVPVSHLYSDGQDNKVIRLCFAKNDETLINAGTLLCRVV